MKLYLAAPYAARDTIRERRCQLRDLGHTVDCSWLDEDYVIGPGTVDAAPDVDSAAVAMHAWDDIREVLAADLFVLHTTAELGVGSASGGRHVETGIALGAGVPVIVVGEPENIFHRLGPPDVTVVASWPAALDAIAERTRQPAH